MTRALALIAAVKQAAAEAAFAALLFVAFVLPLFVGGCYSVHSRTRTETIAPDGTKKVTETNRGAGAVSASGVGDMAQEVGDKAAGFLGLALDTLKGAGVGGGAVGILGVAVNALSKRRIHNQYRERDAHWDQGALYGALAGPRPGAGPAGVGAGGGLERAETP